jgi:HJR/Mrr/RecB family endonuclease
MLQWLKKRWERIAAQRERRFEQEAERQRRIRESDEKERARREFESAERHRELRSRQEADTKEFSALVFAVTGEVDPTFVGVTQVMIDSATPEQFEHMIAAVYRATGWKATVTAGGPDRGVDIVVSRRGEKGVVQAKHWPTGTVGRPILQAIFGEAVSRQCNYAALVTTGSISSGAREFAKIARRHGIDFELLDRHSFQRLVQEMPLNQQQHVAESVRGAGRSQPPGTVVALRSLPDVPIPPECAQHGRMGLMFNADSLKYHWRCWFCTESTHAGGYHAAIKAGAYQVHVYGRRRNQARVEKLVRRKMTSSGHLAESDKPWPQRRRW